MKVGGSAISSLSLAKTAPMPEPTQGRRVFASHHARKRGGVRCRACARSDLQPGDQGPRRISQGEIRQAFNKGWRVRDIQAAELETNQEGDPVKAWLSEIIRDGAV
jgi:hypothetical protein